MKRCIFIFASLIFMLGAALRAQETISRNFLFLLDQGRDMMAVKGIVFDHHMTLIGPNASLQGVFQGPFWYYLLSIPTMLLNGDPWGGVILMFILSILVLLVAYFWTKKLFGNKVAIITLLLFAVSPEAIAAATYTWNPHPMWLLIVLYIFSFYSVIDGKRKFNLMLWLVIGSMFHFEAALAFFILLATISYVLIFSRKIILNKYFLLGVLIFVITFLPQILFDVRHHFLMSRSILTLFTGAKQGLFVGGEDLGYSNTLVNHLLEFYGNFKSSFIINGYLKYLPNISLGLIIIVFLFGSKIKAFAKNELKLIAILGRLILIIILLGFLYPFPMRYWFLTGFQSFYIIILGVIFSKLWNRILGKLIILFVLLIFIFHSIGRLDELYIHPPNDGGVAKIKGKLAAIDYIYKDAKDKKFGLLIFNPPVYTDSYNYLLWWYGENKYHYMPYVEKKGSFYLLMEPDPSKPWSYKGWLETVIKTGTILETKELPSGFIIQKRYAD